MSTLSLDPNPILIATHTGLFLANIYVVKFYIINPFLRLKDKRNNLTSGQESLAVELQQETGEIQSDIKSKIITAQGEAKDYFASQKNLALQKQQEQINNARAKAHTYVEEMKTQIAMDAKKEEEKIPETIENISNQLCQFLMA